MKDKLEVTQELARGLKDIYPNSSESNNWLLLEGVAAGAAVSEYDIDDIDLASTVQGDIAPRKVVPRGKTEVIEEGEYFEFHKLTVDGTLKVFGTVKTYKEEINGSLDVQPEGTYSVEEDFAIRRLSEIGKLVDTTPREGESFAKYRARVTSEFILNTNEGTINELLSATATILDADISSIQYAEPSGGENGTVELDLPGRALDNIALTDTEVAGILERLIAASYRLDAFRRGTFTYITPTKYNNNNHDATKGYDGLDNNGDPKDNGGTYAGLIT